MSYAWQEDLYPTWKEHGYSGILKAVTGSGKTRAGAKAVKRYQEEHPGSSILVVAPRRSIVDHWKKELKENQVEGFEVKTYMKALSDFRLGRGRRADVLVADECHALQTPVQGEVLRYHRGPVLGLSATPEQSTRLIGPVIQDIGFDQANVAPFTVHYIEFEPYESERRSYESLTKRMRDYAEKYRVAKPGQDRTYDFLTFKRRSMCYMMESRLPIALELIKRNQHRRIMVFSERNKQADKLSKLLDAHGIDHAVQTSYHSDVERFETKEVDIIISVKKMREGYNDPETDLAIIVSTATTKRNHIQTIGRVMRPGPGKQAEVYVLVARGTSDEQIKTAVKFPFKTNTTVQSWKG